ncbi:BNR/Asp-box repeat protein [Polystyrenella longa]|uniref:BNR/Asp-box repeat protein n=1 Tax=Polystyrenella longa TaxID=2528007 RepID=A0A518CJI2_9PLAN|nr:sialidase family protein [Polystyrenella longa]QDU79391.1 BNR/Asp-box repeat protein [Polystyrenella longa]
MTTITMLETGRLDERESAFPSTVRLPDGTLLCSYSIEGGQYVHGGTELSRSTDGGKTWERAGTVSPATKDPETANFLKLTFDKNSNRLYAYGARLLGSPDVAFGDRKMIPVICHSDDLGQSWTAAEPLPVPYDFPLEISDRLLLTTSGRLLAPMATLEHQQLLGERVLGLPSDDAGESWQEPFVVFRDPERKRGYFEQKLTPLPDGRLLAVAWTVTLGDYTDLENSYAISEDNGATWSVPQSTGIQGQTMTPLALSENRILITYNRRFGDQGVVAAVVTIMDDGTWQVEAEHILYDAGQHKKREEKQSGNLQDELDTFAFGFPTPLKISNDEFLMTHWSVEQGVCGIRWTRFEVN